MIIKYKTKELRANYDPLYGNFTGDLKYFEEWVEHEIEIEDGEISKILHKLFWIQNNEMQEFYKKNLGKIEVEYK